MSKKIQLSIADPCHENWDNMSRADKGRFCASCQKQVIDFTNMSDLQIAAFFKKPVKSLSKDGSICGRFYNDQLDRDIDIPKKRIPWVKYFFQFAVPAFLFSMKATAQGNVAIKRVTAKSKPVCSVMMGDVDPERTSPVSAARPAIEPKQARPVLELPLLISGKVIDENGNPVPYATVMIKGTKLGGMADSTGIFEIENPLKKEIIIEVSSVGYETKEVPVSKKTGNTNDLLVQLARQVMGEVDVVAYSYRTMGKISVSGAVSVKKEKTDSIKTEKTQMNIPVIKSPEVIPSMIKVYPNPVVSGTSINVGCQKLQEGYYTIQLTNQAGQQVLSKQAWIDGEVQVLNIDLPHTASGIYFLKLTNKETNKRFTQKVIIE